MAGNPRSFWGGGPGGSGTYVTVVAHGATAGTTRPAGAARVFWLGSVQPTNAVQYDRWINSGASPYTESIYNGSAWTALSGGVEDVTTVATSGASQTLTLPATGAGTFDVTLTAATVTLAFAGATSGKADTLTLLARQDVTGGRAITWPGSVTWVGGSAPTLSTAGGSVDVVTFLTVNGGTTWYGFPGSSSSGGSSWRGRSTGWFTNPGQASGGTNFGSASVGAVPLDIGAVTISQLAIQVNTAGAGATCRLGIYSDANGVPGTLLLEPTSATPLDCSTTGVKTTSTFSQAITGRVWLVYSIQGAAINAQGIGGQYVEGVGYDNASNALGFTPTGYGLTGVSAGALPSSVTVSNGGTTAMKIAAKVA